MSIDAFEKREQTLQLHANVLQAEQERIDGAPTLSVSEARKQLRRRKCIMLSGVHIANKLRDNCDFVMGMDVSPSHKFYLLPFYCLNNMNHFL